MCQKIFRVDQTDANIIPLMAMGAAALTTGDLSIRSCMSVAAEICMGLSFFGMLDTSEVVIAFKCHAVRQATFLLREQSMCLPQVKRPP